MRQPRITTANPPLWRRALRALAWRRIPWSLTVLLLLPVTLRAGEPPSIGPQWVTSFWRQVVACDRMASAVNRTWFRTDDGGAVVVTLDRNLLMRRFSADGSVRQAQWLRSQDAHLGEGIDRVAVAADPSTPGFYMLVRSHYCRLVRSSPEFRPRWSVPVPALAPDGEACSDLHVLPDGSVLTLRTSTLARVRADGTVAWTARGGNAFVVDAQGVIWVAGRGDVSANKAAVSRFDLDGQRLSTDEFLCADCTSSAALAIDALPGGDVIVGGGSDYLQPGFLARYDSSGMRRLWIDTEIDVRYSRVVHDLQGSVYVMAEGEQAATGVRRVDAISGLVQWEVPANELVALADGVTVIRRSSSGIVAVGIGADGHARWTESLSPNDNATFSRPSGRDGDGIQLLVQGPEPLSPACGNAPRLLALDAQGNPAVAMHDCTMPLLRSVLAFDVAQSPGVLARLETELVRLDPGGEEQWRATTCDPCTGTPADDAWIAGVLAPDGGGWGVRLPRRPSAMADHRMSVERIRANGTIAFSIPMERAPSNEPSTRVFAMPDRALVLMAAPQRLVWRSIGDGGEVLGLHEHPMPDDDFDILAAHAHADGSLLLIASGETPCYFGCTPFNLSVLRIAPDGQLAWRHDFPDAHWKAALAPDGTSVLVSPGDNPGDPLLLRRIDVEGDLAAPLPLAGVPPLHFAIFFVGPASGHWMLTTGGSEPWDSALWSLDAQGHVEGARFDLAEEPRGYGDDGFVFSVVHEDGPRMHLLDPRTLASRLQFPHGGGDAYSAGILPWNWRQLADGTAYSSWTLPGYKLGIARYAMPWDAPQDGIFRNSFD